MPPPHGKVRWQLTEATFACLLRALGERDPRYGQDETRAIERYQRLQGRLILFFMRHRSIFPEDLADEVINRLARALYEGRAILNIEAFSLGVARLVLREEQARLMREQRSFAEEERNRRDTRLTYSESQADPVELELKEAEVAALPEEARAMLGRYHAGSGSERFVRRQRLAEELGISMGALRKRVFDLQVSLRAHLRKRLNNPGRVSERKEKSHL